MIQIPSLFVPDLAALLARMLLLKQERCPFCERSLSLNRHSFLYGNNPAGANCKMLRGQRVLCSNRGQRGGCGRSFSIFLADILPRHSITAVVLWALLVGLLDGHSLKATAEALRFPFAIESFYHLLKRVRGRLDVVRSLLHGQTPPPSSSRASPLLQTIEHLCTAFPQAECPMQAFQVFFQTALMG